MCLGLESYPRVVPETVHREFFNLNEGKALREGFSGDG
jgi:hypothetical protein